MIFKHKDHTRRDWEFHADFDHSKPVSEGCERIWICRVLCEGHCIWAGDVLVNEYKAISISDITKAFLADIAETMIDATAEIGSKNGTPESPFAEYTTSIFPVKLSR